MNGFKVRFTVFGKKWATRLPRPVTDAVVAAEVKRKTTKSATAETTSDYGGVIKIGGTPVGDYFIEPGSEK